MLFESKPLARTAPRAAGALIALVGLSWAGAAAAQVVPYFKNQYGAAYVPITGGTPVSFFSNDDDTSLIPIGFPFTYYGETYTQVFVGTNGAMSFAQPCTVDAQCSGFFPFCDTSVGFCDTFISTGSFGVPAIPSIDSPDAVVAPFWDDLFITTGAVTYTVLGAAPSREFVVQWNAVGHYTSGSASVSNATFQVRLSEASGAVRLHYGTFSPVASENSLWAGTIGIENGDGTIGDAGLPCGTTATCGVTDLTSLNNQVIEWASPAGVELVASGVSATGGNPGDTVNVQVTARNVGTLTATGTWTAAVYLSTDAAIDASDTLLGQLTFGPLASRSAQTSTLTAVVPSLASGFYTVGVIMDSNNDVAEDVETNNIAILSTRFLIGTDLAAEIDTPADTGAGETVDITVRILNLGAAQGAVPYHVYLSRDRLLDSSDILIQTATVAVPAAPSTSFTFPALIPTVIPGGYYALVDIDPNNIIVEADETNNLGVSPNTTTLAGADLVANEVETPGVFAFRGLDLEVYGTISNDGLASANGFLYGIYMSENQLCSAVSDTLLAELGPLSLSPGESTTFNELVPVPSTLTPGPYYLCLIVNSQSTVLEERQNNNLDRTTRTIEVRDPAPDFIATEIRLPARAAAGESVTLQRTLLNDGNAAGAGDYQVYLSADNALDPAQDVLLGTPSTSLAAGAEDIGVDTLLIPSSTPAGAYYVIYVLDPAGAVDELFEDNNVLVSGATLPVLPSDLSILTTSLPMGTVGVPYDVFVAAAGGAGSYTFSLAMGVLPAGLSLDASGRLSGTPTEEGVADVVITVTDGALIVAKAFTLLVADQTTDLEILTTALPPGFVERPYAYPLTAFGGVRPYLWTLTGGDALPEGLFLSDDGRIEGTPSITSISRLNVRVTDALGAFAERPLTLRVVNATDAVRMSNDVLPDGRLGEAYDEVVRVASGTGTSPFVFTVADGALPDGLVLEGDRIYGEPSRVGLFTFSIRVVDSRGDFDLNTYTVEIDESDGVTFVTNSLPRGEVNKAYVNEAGEAVVMKAISTTGTVTFALVEGDLPTGLTLASDGGISGTPSSSGTFSFTVIARDTVGQYDLRAFGIIVDEPEVVDPLPTGGDDGCSCTSAHEGRGAGAWSLLGLLGGLFLVRRRGRAPASLLALAVLAAPSLASAQVPYFVDTRAENYVERSGGTPVPFQGTDDSQGIVPLPFPFRFYSTDYTSASVGTNGFVAFGGSATSLANDTMPSTSSPNELIALWWDDLITNGATTYLEGTAPSRVFIIQYDTVQRYSGAGGNPKFQLWLYEGQAGRFEVHYGPVTGMTDPFAWTASAGWENANGTLGGNFLSCVSPACNGNDLAAATNTVVRVQQDAGPDVQAAGIVVPSSVFAGVPFTTSVTMASLHQNALGPFRYTVHVMGPTETVPNNPIFESGPVTLAPYQALTVTATPTVPLSLPFGRYRLALVVDPMNELVEPDETNNILISTDTFRVAAQQPDFVVTDVTASVQAVEPQGSFQATLYLRNRGNLDATSDWRLVLSRNQVVSRDDFQLASGTESLPLLTTATVTVDVTLPAQVVAGQYYLGVVMDPDNAVQEIDEVNNTRASATTLSVATDAVNIDTSALPGAYVGVAYTHFLRASGGDGHYTWSLQGSLPQGMSLVPNSGELRGTPTTVGQATVTVQVESAGHTASRTLSVTVAEPDGGLTVVTRDLLPGQVGAAYPPAGDDVPVADRQHIQALGNSGEVTFTVEGNIPTGLTLDEDGYLHGVPVQAGVYELNVVAKDDVTEARRTLRLTVATPGRLTLVASTLPDGRVGENYVYELRVVGGSRTSTVSFSASGPLPPGVVVSTEGRVVGVPQQVGAWVFTVTASEGTGATAAQDSATFRLAVVQDEGFAITPTSVPYATLGEVYETELGTRNGQGSLSWRVAGPSLPRGLSYEVAEVEGEQKLRFRGTPEEVDTVSVLVTCTDSVGRFTQTPITLEVREKVVEKPPVLEDTGCTCVANSVTGGSGLVSLGLLGLLVLRRRRR
ncbi:MAG: putative Ig domain-containing protein [Myxococcales bacterium]|nr:putative Ig domain-containing protein [Myxococcales bacterium]